MPAEAFFEIEMLAADHGDCLWVEYGRGKKRHRILIDGGPIGAFEALDSRMNAIPARKNRTFELVVLTHIDADHVDGLIRLFAEKPLRCSIDEVWFNGWRHLTEGDRVLGGLQGEYFSAIVDHRLGERKWNTSTGGKALVVEDEGALPYFKLPGGMKLTLLSPTRGKLHTLKKDWKKHIATEGIDPGDLDAALAVLAEKKRYLPDDGLVLGASKFDKLLAAQMKPDNKAANGSSIAFLCEFADKKCLFLADAHTDVVVASLRRLLKARRQKRLKVDAVKISHHGSKGNTSAELIALVDAKYFLISSNGAQFKHPDQQPVAFIIDGAGRRRPVLRFNYRTKFNEMWFDESEQAKRRYSAVDASGDPVLAL